MGRVVQLGDVGSGKLSGTREAFLAAKGYLEGLGVPFMVITGNHDLEGPMFETDEENLAAWADVFNQRCASRVRAGGCGVMGQPCASATCPPTLAGTSGRPTWALRCWSG